MVVGNRITPILFPKLCVTSDNKLSYSGFLGYYIITYLLAIVLWIIYIVFFNFVVYDMFLVDILGTHDEDTWVGRPYFFMAFFMGE